MTSPSPPRASRELSENEVKRVLAHRDTQVCEWEALGGRCFYMNRAFLAIVSTNSAGSDIREVLWAVKYPNDIAFLIECNEIKSVPGNVRRIPK